MAHLNRKQKNRLAEIRENMTTYLVELMEAANQGNVPAIMEFCNSGSVKLDVEWLLARPLSDSEATALLTTPEDNSDVYGAKFGKAHAIALNMKHTRQLCRTLCRQARMEKIGPTLADLLGEIEAYAF